MRPKQIAITIISTSILTLYTIQSTWGWNNNYIIPYAIGYFFTSCLAWKAILPNRDLLDIPIREGVMFPIFVMVAVKWSTTDFNPYFHITFMVAFVISWLLLNVVSELMMIAFSPTSNKPKRQTSEG